MTKIAVLGAGYAGVQGAKLLHKYFKKNKDVEITLFDKNPFHTLMTELHEVAGGRADGSSVQVPLSTIFGGKKVHVRIEKITQVKFEENTLVSETGESYSYDYLILGSGSEPESFGVPGVYEHGYTLWSYDDAIKLRTHIEDCFLAASREPVEEKRRLLLSFAVAGAGFTGMEMLGELVEWKSYLCKRYEIKPEEVSIMLVEAMADILPVLSAPLRKKALKFLAKKKVDVRLNAAISGVTPEGFTLKDGSFVSTKTLIWTCGVRGSTFAGQTGLEQKRNRILTNEYLQSLKHSNVFIVGDNLWLAEKEKPLPQVVETALQTGETAAHNIHALIKNKPLKKHHAAYHGFLVSIGSRYCVAEAMGIKMSGFIAMASKHFVNLHYLLGVAGVNSIWAYLQHHFLELNHRRSMIGSLVAEKTRSIWLLPIRVGLAAMWAVEALEKILKGWLDPSKGPVSSWMFSPGVVQAGTDAVSGASNATSTTTTTTVATVQAASDAVAAATSTDGGAATTQAATQSVELLKSMNNPILPHDFFLVKWMQWFMDHFISQVPYQFLQFGVVTLESLLCLALLSGTFTFLAGAVSLVLVINFTLAGFITWNMAWMILASIAVLGGAGRVVGLDYWLMPWLQKKWNKTGLAKKTYWFIN